MVVMNRHGELVDRRRHAAASASATALVYGAELKVAGRRRGQGRRSCSPSGTRSRCRSSPRSAASVKFGDIVEGVTMQEKVDEVTGLSRKVVIETKDARPAAAHLDQGRRRADRQGSRAREARYLLPVGAHLRRRRTATSSSRATSSRRSRARPRRPRTSPAVCRASPSSSRRASRRSTPIITEIDGVVSFGKDTQGQAQGHRHAGGRRAARVPDPEGQAHQRARGRPRPRRRAADGRPGEPARHPRDQGREGAREVPGRRDPGGLPPAGRAHQRQAHRGDRPADAPPRAHQGRRRHGLPRRRAGREVTSSRRRTSA